jgi:hypothetical protein
LGVVNSAADFVRTAPAVRRVPIDGGLLLLDTSSNTLLAFNDTARHVWDLLAIVRGSEELVTAFAAWWGIPLSRAQADVSSILTQWRDLGLLAGGTSASPQSEAIAAVDVDAAPPCQPTTRWTCTIRGKTIEFAAGDNLAPRLRSLFQHLETPQARPHAHFEIKLAANREMVLIEDGVERLRTGDSGQILGALFQAVLERIYPGMAWLALLHGAAVARNGAGFGLAGPTGSGKSTLAAGLLTAGFDYLADDMIALSAPDGAIVSWPLPLSIKPGSVEVIAARHPELAQAAAYRTKGLEARLLIPPASAWDSDPVRLRTLVFPQFAAGATADLQRISAFDAAQRLLADRIWFGNPITEQRVTAFLTWLNDTPAFALSYGSLDDAVRLIDGIVS